MIVCDHDCFNCPYPDVPEECLSRSLTYDEYRELAWIEAEIINPKTAAQKKAAAQQKAWYEANREKVAARKKAYREANRERVAAQQKVIAVIRKRKGVTQSDLAALAGVRRATISLWETGQSPADWNKLCAVLPELGKCRPLKKAATGGPNLR